MILCRHFALNSATFNCQYIDCLTLTITGNRKAPILSVWGIAGKKHNLEILVRSQQHQYFYHF